MTNQQPPREGWVLIIEDDRDIAETMTEMLDERGYCAETAVNGAAALERLRSPPLPSVILLDLTMPVMDGQEFRRAQLAAPELASIPVVVLTADTGARGHSELGATGYLIKPVSLDSLVETVRRYCGPARR